MMEFEALNIPALTEEIAVSLEKSLKILPGITQLEINVDTRSVQIIFDEGQLGFLTLIQTMAQAGCPLRRINAALLKDLSKK